MPLGKLMETIGNTMPVNMPVAKGIAATTNQVAMPELSIRPITSTKPPLTSIIFLKNITPKTKIIKLGERTSLKRFIICLLGQCR